MGKLANSTWYLSRANAQTTSGLAASTPASSSSCWRWVAHSWEGSVVASQSTSWPSMANSSASKAAIVAVQSVIVKM